MLCAPTCRRLLSSLLLILVVGCNLGFADDPDAASDENQCDDNNQCGEGYCSGGICRTKSTELGALLLYITPAAGTPIIAGVGFTEIIEELNFDRGPGGGYEISLGHVSRVRGPVRATSIDPDNCVIDEGLPIGVPHETGSIAARLTLTPTTRLLGLSSPAHTVEVSDPGSDGYALNLAVPQGRYDIYVEPRTTEAGCFRPPFLALDQEIPTGDVELGITLPQPTALEVRVRYPGGGSDLRGWTVDVIERISGRRLSNSAVLNDSIEIDGGWQYTAHLSFSEVAGVETNPASELVRLSPPEDVVGPRVYVERSVVELFQGGDGLIDQLTELPSAVTFSARVATDDAAVAVPSNVIFLATGLSSTGPGTVAAFSNSTTTNESGIFEIQLLPGTYRVFVEPRDESLRPVETQVTVSDADVQAGRTIEIEERRLVSGQLLDFKGNSISGVPIVMTSSALAATSSVLEMAQGRQVFLPFATSVATKGEGRFSLRADPGAFFVTARPQSNTGYPWHVFLNARVDEEDLNLGRMRLPLPVVVSGTLTSQDIGDVVPEALIVAYAMLADGMPVGDPAEANRVIPVAEARVDADGRFRLLLPSDLN